MTQGTASTGPQASAPTRIDIYDNDVWIGTADIGSDGAWDYPAGNLQRGEHQFTAKAGASTSNAWTINVEASIDATAPFIEGVRPPINEKQTLDYYNINDDIHVVVPNHHMLSDDTVKVYWKGRSTTLGSEIQTVGSPPAPLKFKISKYEVIDVIGYNSTDVWYTLRRPSTGLEGESRHLQLSVTGSGQNFALNAPTVNGSKDNLRVWRQSQFDSTTTARVRAIGVTEWESHSQEFGTRDSLDFPIDAEWLKQNRGLSVVFNYSLRLRDDGGHFLFSQLLRINPL
jgi:hypothetical protein